MTDQNELRVKISVDGRHYDISFREFTAIDARDFRETMGMSLIDGFRGQVDADVLAALLWLHRRRTNKKLTFEKVAEKFTYADLIVSNKLNFDEDDEDDEAEVIDVKEVEAETDPS